MILLIDNYDSFTYNVADLLAQLGPEVRVVRNNEMSLGEIDQINPSHLVISPGPGRPEQAGMTVDLIRHFAGKIPILGVCLGHQAIAQVFGGEVVRTQPVHGKTSQIIHDAKGVFSDLPSPFLATRYHSLVVRQEGLPSDLEVSAKTESGEIMGLRHRKLPVEGVQFHPESILSEHGAQLFRNFLQVTANT